MAPTPNHQRQQRKSELLSLCDGKNEMPSPAKDIMKKLLSAWAFISTAFNHVQYKLILSSHAVPIWMLGYNKGGEIREREITFSVFFPPVASAHLQTRGATRGHIRCHKGRQQSTSRCRNLIESLARPVRTYTRSLSLLPNHPWASLCPILQSI